MPLRPFRNVLLIILLIGGNAYAQTQLPKCVLFGFGNCIGTLRFSNGDIYTGEFKYGKPNGKGAFTYVNGDSYNGTIAEGQRHGSGTYTSAAGDKYVGQFSEGRFEGVGTYYFLANNRSKGDVYTGEFSSNTFNGQGRYTHSNGQVFVGSFVNGRKAVPIVAPETLLAQAEVHRLAEENAKQKAQLESQLEAERRERLAREKQAAAVLVAQVEAQRIAEENAKQKAQLESQLEAERRERLARDKEAVAAVIAKQDVQVAPIASPALAMVVVPASDKAAPQPLIVLAKSESVPGNVEPVGKDSESKDSAVKAPLAAESRTEEQVTTYGERSKWYVTGGVVVSQSYYCYYPSCTNIKILHDTGIGFGLGYELTNYFALESEISAVTTEKVWEPSLNYSTWTDAVGYKAGALLSTDLTDRLMLIAGGGYYMMDWNIQYSLTSGNKSQHYTYDNFYLSLGADLKITDSTSLRFKWSRYATKDYGIADSGGVESYNLGLKYNF